LPAQGETYRRLPGRRRGIGSSASLWLGSDHILLVKSVWFRETYKRFYLRDIQAIVVASGARFYVSRYMLALALGWLLPGFAIAFWPSAVALGWSVGTVAMAATWLAVSIAASCRCRIYTAVSKDDLSALYRTWTARRFLRQVQPRIEQVQGAVDAGWAEAERANTGPAAAPLPPAEPPKPAAAPSHTLLSDLFVLSLFAGSVVSLAAQHSAPMSWFRWNTGLNLVELAGAVAVLVEYSRGRLARPMQRIGIAALALVGGAFYAQIFVFSIAAYMTKGANVAQPAPAVSLRYAIDGVRLLLGFLGAGIILRGGRNP